MQTRRSKALPIYVQKWLSKLPIKHVAVLADLYDKEGQEIFQSFLELEVERLKTEIFLLPETNPVTLAIGKAAKRGAVEEVTTIKLLIRGARKELEKRIANE